MQFIDQEKVEKMRQKLLYMMTLLTLLVSAVSVEAENTAADFSADYKQGYEDAAELYKPLATVDGMLQATKILLDVFGEGRADGGFAGELCSGFIDATAPTYNEEVTEYNELVVLTNFVIDTCMGPGHDDLKFELAPYFY